jgi:hypothetical protein
MTIILDDDPILVIRAMGEMVISLFAMHMSPEACAGAAAHLRELAATQDTHKALGVAQHPANGHADTAMLRMLADFYEAARTERLAKLAGQTLPAPGHFHTVRDGVWGLAE